MHRSPKWLWILKQLVPAPLKRSAKAVLLDWKLRRAVKRIAILPPGQNPSAKMLNDLQAGWGNQDYAALASGSVVLLDDTERAGETEVLRRWATEARTDVILRKTSSGSFAQITVNENGSRGDATYSPGRQESDNSIPPLISIIIPAYNVAPYIRETLDSVFSQTFTDYEVILVNDGSLDSDDLKRALEPYASRLRYVDQENSGVSVARNQGLRMARGEFIAFLDGDDVWLPNYLEEQQKFLREHNCDLVCADAMMFGDSPAPGRTYMEWLMETSPPAGEVTFLELVNGERSLIISGVLTRRTLIFDIGLFDDALRNAQDFDLWLRLARHGARLYYQRKVLLRYRCRGDSLTGNAANSVTRELRVLDKIEQSYALTPVESAEISPIIRGRKGVLEFELGKLLMAQGDVGRARASFAKACSARRTWKRQAALLFSRFASGPMHLLCRRRLARANAK